MTNIILAQLNPTVGNLTQNLQKIEKILEQHDNKLIVLPEMYLTGYPLEDLSQSEDLAFATHKAIQKIQTLAGTNTILLGALTNTKKEKYHNSAVLITNKEIKTAHKTALPTYGVFDEKRLFTAGKKILEFTYDNETIAVAICEDVWDKSSPAYKQLTKTDAQHIIVLNGSPFEGKNKITTRLKITKTLLNKSKAENLIYLNLTGGQDDIIFDGGSFTINKNKGLTNFLKLFEEEILEYDTEKQETIVTPVFDGNELTYKASVLGVRDYIKKNNMDTVLVGISGGIDSAIVATIAADAIGGEKIYGVAMPSEYSSEHSVTDAKQLMENIGGHYREQPIKEIYNTYKNNIELTGVADENLQARIRGTILMGISNQENRLVLTPGNKSELAVGYSTVYGDTVGGYAPIKDMFKTTIYQIAKWRNNQGTAPIPENSIKKAPSAELKPGQVDNDTLPDYDTLDSFLQNYLENKYTHEKLIKEYGEALTNELISKVKNAEWKRNQYPIGPKLTKLSFGRERKMPITNQNNPKYQ